jgi:hypothetical protein
MSTFTRLNPGCFVPGSRTIGKLLALRLSGSPVEEDLGIADIVIVPIRFRFKCFRPLWIH